MTISYQCDVRNASVISFCRILFRWKGSIWKAVVFELTIWSLLYASVSVFYRSNWFLNAKQKRGFAEVAHLIRRHMNLFPITFILGFYVSAVAKRWVDMIRNMGYVDNLALLIGNYIRGEDEYARLMRRAMVRWVCLSQVLVYRDINIGVRKRFPTLESIVKAGLIA
ncbi:hypothetical protein AB6A40_010401 [Gnathostoma spinigerum]|uniref:Bestrophin homolog n=1 Tax=Gnathostoma spinigerum TaxID=75299 RepID=A0ABD6F2N6_9BILA